MADRPRRRGPALERARLFAMRRVLFNVWRLAEMAGLRVAPEGPPHAPTDSRRREMDSLLARARATGSVVDSVSLDYPVHELLTHLVEEYGLLLHGTNRRDLEVIEPRAAVDYGTRTTAVVAADDGIWPLFYAVVDRSRIEGVFTACMHLGRPPGRRRFYTFRIFGADPVDPSSWTDGAVYAIRRRGFRREWGNEWLRASEVTPVLRVLVRPADFPLRDVVRAAQAPGGPR